MPDNFQPESLSWALTHVRRFGDTDIFPVPFEYVAIAHNWNSLGPYLQSLDFGTHRTFADRRVMVVKPGGGFRAALQLDPFDLGQAEKESFTALFAQCVQRPWLHVGLARHLLRKARQSRTVVLNELVFDHMEALAPVMRDVVRCLTVTIPKKQAAEKGQQLLRFCATSDIGNLAGIVEVERIPVRCRK